MISRMKRIVFDVSDKPWTESRMPEIAKCLNDVLSKSGDPFTRLYTSYEMAEVIYKITGSKKAFQTSNGDILNIVITSKYTVNNPWFVQTFHGFDCSEILFDFSAAFTTPFKTEKKEEVKVEPVEVPVETPKEEVKTEKKETKNNTDKKLKAE